MVEGSEVRSRVAQDDHKMVALGPDRGSKLSRKGKDLGILPLEHWPGLCGS